MLAVGLLALLLPSVASAGTVSIVGAGNNIELRYLAAAGEQNQVTVDYAAATLTFTVDDPGAATLTAGAGCTGSGPVTCVNPATPGNVRRVRVTVLDLADVVTVGPGVTIPAFLLGGPGGDTLNGGPGGDTLTGEGDDDTLNGGAGNDRLDSGDGDDTIRPGLGIDLLSGGGGTDWLSYTDRSDPIRVHMGSQPVPPNIDSGTGGQWDGTARDPSDTDIISFGVENFEGGNGNDYIDGSRSRNVLKGGPGADIISGDQGPDTVDYSDPGNPAPVTVTLGDSAPGDPPPPLGNDGHAGEQDNVLDDVESITGGDGNDILTGQDRIPATSGTNPRSGQEGANVLEGGKGDDLLDGKEDADIFDGGEGVDTVTYESRIAPVVGTIDSEVKDDGGVVDTNDITKARDTILESVENVIGGSGNDILRGNGPIPGATLGANLLDGRGGIDQIAGAAGDDVILGGDGDDPLLEGAGGNDVVQGGAGADDLDGGDGEDQLDGGDGEDLLDGGSGADTIAGGPGFDGADYSSRLGPVSASADGVGGDGQAGEGDNIAADVEDLIGGIDDDTLVGSGGDGIIDGGGGDDLLDGGGGADDLIGGAGADRASYASRTAPVAVDLNTLGGDGQAGEDDDIADDIEKVSGGGGADVLTGDGAANILNGGDGADTISGGGGFDLLHGDGGNDRVNGNGGTDQVFGDAGNDTLLGESDNDTLHGGANDDSLDGGTGADILNGNEGSDTANYAARTSALNVTLDGAPNDGQSGEGDLVKTDVEGVSTGSGNDTINSADGVSGRISCGGGRDTVTADNSDTVAADCESRVVRLASCSVSRSSARMSRSGVVPVRINCAASGRGRVTLRGGGRKLGSKSFSIRAGKVKTVRVKLSRKGRRTVNRARRNRLRARATISSLRSGKVRQTRSNTRTITIRGKR